MKCKYAKCIANPRPDGLDVALLTEAEEKQLAAAIARGDVDAKNQLICANLRLVIKIARSYLGRGLMLDDLIGEGNLGLIRACEEYDPKFNTRFSTYAAYWIKQSIRHALINTTAAIRLPAHIIGLMTKYRRMEQSLNRELGYAPSPEEVLSQLGLSELQQSLIAKARRASNLKLESSFTDTSCSWTSSKADDPRESLGATIEAEEERLELSEKLKRLDVRERAILHYRFGLDGQATMTLKAVAKRLGVTREWVRRIEIRALRKLGDMQMKSVESVSRPVSSGEGCKFNAARMGCSLPVTLRPRAISKALILPLERTDSGAYRHRKGTITRHAFDAVAR